MQTIPDDARATSPTPTTTTTKRGWKFWYTLIIITLTVIAMRDDMAGTLYAIPFNWLLYFIPTWLVVQLVRAFRK